MLSSSSSTIALNALRDLEIPSATGTSSRRFVKIFKGSPSIRRQPDRRDRCRAPKLRAPAEPDLTDA